MLKSKILASLILIITAGALILTTALARRQEGSNQEGTKQKKLDRPKDFSRFPITDYHAPESSDPAIRAKRQAKGRKYDDKYMPQISENTDTIFSISDWDVRLPALPVERSAAVVIGKIISSKAYLTPAKTGIYSEFEVVVDSIAKNDSNNPIKTDTKITVERNGGRVRMPSGKIVLSWVNHQNMPREGGRYLLFLTHDFQTLNDSGKDFYILTGYELEDGTVRLLDDPLPGHPMTRYNGMSESALLNDLFNVIAKTSN
jgi:hypothetical protein